MDSEKRSKTIAALSRCTRSQRLGLVNSTQSSIQRERSRQEDAHRYQYCSSPMVQRIGACAVVLFCRIDVRAVGKLVPDLS